MSVLVVILPRPPNDQDSLRQVHVVPVRREELTGRRPARFRTTRAPEGVEAGMRRPAVVVTAQRILEATPSIIQVVPLTGTTRSFHSEVLVEPDSANGLGVPSAAQCQHLRAISPGRIVEIRGNVGAAVLTQVRETIAVILDLP